MSDQSDHQDDLRRKHLVLTLMQSCAVRSIEVDDFVTKGKITVLEDGGMGSFEFEGLVDQQRSMVITAKFDDADHVECIIDLYVTLNGMPSGLDIWKTSFEELCAIPSPNQLLEISCRTLSGIDN